MKTFIKYLSRAHHAGKNIALYAADGCAVVIAENVATNEELASLSFENAELAEDWFDSMKGDDVGKLINALDALALATGTKCNGFHLSDLDNFEDEFLCIYGPKGEGVTVDSDAKKQWIAEISKKNI